MRNNERSHALLIQIDCQADDIVGAGELADPVRGDAGCAKDYSLINFLM